MAVGITDYGVYIPRYRITRKAVGENWSGGGRGEISVAGGDEDVITMAVEACGHLFNNTDPAGVDALFIGSSSFPNYEYSSSALIRETLGLPHGAETADLTGSVRASLAGLKACIDGIEAGRFRSAIVVGSDNRQPGPGTELEREFGAAAAGFLLQKTSRADSLMAEIVNIYNYNAIFSDCWTNQEDGRVWDYEPRFSRQYGYEDHIVEAVGGFFKQYGCGISDFDYFVLQSPNSRIPQAAAKRLGIPQHKVISGAVTDTMGDLGNCSVFMGLAIALEKAAPGQKILLASYGSGVCDVISLKAAPGIARAGEKALTEKYLQSKQYINYVQYLKYRNILVEAGVEPALGVPAMSPLVWRDSEALHRLVGNKCAACGHVNFPPSYKFICVRCGGTKMEKVAIAKKGTVHTYASSYYLPKPLESPLPVMFVDLEDGTRMRALGTELATEDLKIDMPVELVFRRIAVDRGFSMYGYKGRGVRF
jgi:hydroxymethylglutaryl-CoA synthase